MKYRYYLSAIQCDRIYSNFIKSFDLRSGRCWRKNTNIIYNR